MLSPAVPEPRRVTAKSGGRNLSAPRRRLIDLLGHVHFGRVLDLHVQAGEPVFDGRGPRTVRTVKLCGTKQPSSRPGNAHVLEREMSDLLRLLDDVRDGLVGRIEVAHGLPLFAEVHETAPAV